MDLNSFAHKVAKENLILGQIQWKLLTFSGNAASANLVF